MKKVWNSRYVRGILLILTILSLGILADIVCYSSVDAEDTIYLENLYIKKDLPTGTGSDFLQFVVGNLSDTEREYRIEFFPDYTTRDSDETPLDSSWFTFRDPSVFLPPGGRDVFHVDFSVSSIPDGKYTGWFKVYDVPQTQFRVISFVIRVGSAIPKFDFMIKGNTVFTVPVWGPRETQTTDKVSFKIANTGSAASRYLVYPRAPDTYTKGGVVYQYLPECREWIDFKAESFEEHPAYSLAEHPETTVAKKAGTKPNEGLQALQVDIAAYSEQTVIVPLQVPADAENGLYVIFLQVVDMGPEDWEDQSGMGLSEAYAIKLFFELDREGNPKSDSLLDGNNRYYLVGGGILILILGFVVVAPLVSDKLSEKKQNKPVEVKYGRR